MNCEINGWKGGELLRKWCEMVKKNWILVIENFLIKFFTSVTVAPGRVGSTEKSAGQLWEKTGRSRVGIGSGWWPRSVAENCRWCPDRSREVPSRHIVEHLVCVRVVSEQIGRFRGLARVNWIATGFVRVVAEIFRGVPMVARVLPMVARSGIWSSTWCVGFSGTGAGSRIWAPGMGSGFGLWTGLEWTVGLPIFFSFFIFFNPN